MEIYLVGGAVRDTLLGLPVEDRDWLVVGASPEQMTAKGFIPVGRDFPVFLHPVTSEEYALARTERKTARGYRGFAIQASPEVTLEEDLARRDLTINSIAVNQKSIRADGTFSIKDLSDPYGGYADLQTRIFRHVTPAFREDPVRILRVARLAARFADFSVAPETLLLMAEMVDAGEVDHLVPERVWQELSRGLMAPQPSRMLRVLHVCGALAHLLPGLEIEMDQNAASQTMARLDVAAHINAPLTVRFACLRLSGTLNEKLRVPLDCRELAEVVQRELQLIDQSSSLDAEALVHLLERCDAIRKPTRFEELLLACECHARALQDALQDYPPAQHLKAVQQTVVSLPTRSISEQALKQGLKGEKIGELIHLARVKAVAALSLRLDPTDNLRG